MVSYGRQQQDRIKALEAERDTAVAQVAVLVDALRKRGWHDADCDKIDGEACSPVVCGLDRVLSDIPAAAARYLAADKFCVAFDAVTEGQEALFADWRKAANHE